MSIIYVFIILSFSGLFLVDAVRVELPDLLYDSQQTRISQLVKNTNCHGDILISQGILWRNTPVRLQLWITLQHSTYMSCYHGKKNAPFLSCTMAIVTNWALTMAKFTIMSCRNESMDFKMSEILHRSEMCSYINCTLNIFFSKCNEFISSFHNQRRWRFPALSC